MKIEQAREIVSAIVRDLEDRGGISNEWDEIDDDTQAEIRQAWAEIVFEIANGI